MSDSNRRTFVGAADRSLGQHMLLDGALARRSVAAAELRAGARVLEIGPGTGVLTAALLDAGHRVTAIELDPRMRPALDDLAAGAAGRLEVRWGDALDTAWPTVDAVVANLPYGPALPLVFRILGAEIPVAILLMQRSLAERLAADPGEPRYGGVTVRARRLSSARILEPVAPHQFDPPPAVESAVVRLRRVETRFPLPTPPRSGPRNPESLPSADEEAGHAADPAGASAVPDDAATADPSDGYWRALLDALFLHRDAPLSAALAALGAPTSAVLKGLDRGARGRLPNRPVVEISPNDFGRIAWAAALSGWVPPAVSAHEKRTAQGGASG